MAKYATPSIDSYGGPTAYLNATKAEHNGYDATDLKNNWKWGAGKHMNISNLAIMFGVSWPTMDDWINRLHREAGIDRPGRSLASTSDLDNTK